MSKVTYKSHNHNKSWRQVQNSWIRHRQIKFGVIILVLLSLLVVFSKAVNLFDTNNKSYTWDGESGINLLIKSQSIQLFSLNPDKLTISIIEVPDDTYLTLPQGYGSWRARAVYDLGQSESPTNGMNLLQSALSLSFGIPIDGYIILQTNNSREVFELIRKNIFNAFSLINVESNLSRLELLKLAWVVKDVRGDKIKYIDLSQTDLTKSKLLPDGSRVLGIDSSQSDRVFQRDFIDQQIVNEGLTIAVLNGTKTPGVANFASRLVTNMGGRVIISSSAETEYKNTLVFGTQSKTLNRLYQIFAPNCIPNWLSFTSTRCNMVAEDSAADITVILGADYLDKL